MEYERASCPCAVSFIFKAIIRPDTVKSGSIGIGCTINKQVTVTVAKANSKLQYLNGKAINIPTIDTALKHITKQKLKIEIESELPPASGFGISGASTLAALFAVNNLLKLNIPGHKLMEIAHTSEIKEKTGLGTVATQITGGFLIKTKPGLPPVYKRLPFAGKKIYAVYFGQLPTQKILADREIIKRVNKACDIALKKIMNIKFPGLDEIIGTAFDFVKQSNIFNFPEAIPVIKRIRKMGGFATIAIIGKVIFSTIKPKTGNYKIFELEVSDSKIEF